MKSSRYYLAFFCLIETACSEAPTAERATPESVASTVAEAVPERKATYRIPDVIKNESSSKLNANILLSKKVDEAQLREFGIQIKDSISGYEKNYFFFYLDGMKIGSGAWATTTFATEEEI